MFGTIRKHQQWLWMIIITVIIISFVIFFSPDIGRGTFSKDTRKYVNGKPVTINGQPISNDEYAAAFRETYLANFMRTGGREWPNNDENTQKGLERDAIFRVFVLKKAKEMDIHVSENAVAKVASDRLGGFPLAQFEKEYLLPRGLTIDDFERYLRNDLIIQQLISTAAVSSKLYSPEEGEAFFRKQNEQNDARLAVFWGSNYLSKVTVTPQDLTNHYNRHMGQYRIPERVVVNYVEFPATNFLAEADKKIANLTNFNAEVENTYFKRGTNFWKDTNGVIMAEADAKKKIREDFRTGLALTEARRKASDFGSALYNEEAKTLTKHATNAGLVVKTSPPLERMLSLEDEEKGSEFNRDFRERAFALSTNTPVSFNPILGEKAVYVIALKEKMKGEFQPIGQIYEKLTQDFKNTKAIELARADGTNFYDVLTNGLAKMETFEAICTRARVTFITPPKYSAASTPNTITNLDERISLQTLQNLANELKAGQVSQFTPADPVRTPEGRYLPSPGGFIFYLKEKLPVDEATVKKELPEHMAKMRVYRQNEAFNQWFRKQIEQNKLYIAPAPENTGITQRSS